MRPSGYYTPEVAQQYTVARRRKSRRNTHFSDDEWILVEHLVALDWSPEQVSGWLSLHGILSISHETIYLRVWHDKRQGGDLWSHIDQSDLDAIAHKLNTRPRKRLVFRTPEECYAQS